MARLDDRVDILFKVAIAARAGATAVQQHDCRPFAVAQIMYVIIAYANDFSAWRS
jgi:hypothetical protein